MVNPPIPLSGTALSQPPSLTPTTAEPAIDVNQQRTFSYLETIAGVVGAVAAVAVCFSKC